MSNLILEFPDDEVRDIFLAMLCDGGVEDSIYESMSMQNIRPSFNYDKAYTSWGWDGKGDPKVKITVPTSEDEE